MIVFWAMTLEELRRATIAGQPGAREELARQLRAMLWRGLSKHFPADVADDLTQQALLTIFAKLDSFRPWHDDDAFDRWVNVISARAASRRAMERRRARARERVGVDALVKVAAPGDGPSTRLRNRDLLRAVVAIVETLKTALREAALALIAGERVKDVAERQGLPLGTAYSRRRKLRQLLLRALMDPRPVSWMPTAREESHS